MKLMMLMTKMILKFELPAPCNQPSSEHPFSVGFRSPEGKDVHSSLYGGTILCLRVGTGALHPSLGRSSWRGEGMQNQLRFRASMRFSVQAENPK